MASLRDTVKEYQEELRDGIAWVAFWKEGHSWNAEYKWYNKYVQKIQNKNVQMLYCYHGGKQYDFKK